MTVALTLFFCAKLLGGALGFPGFAARIPNGGNVMRNGQLWPGVGHNARAGGGSTNPFGIAFAQAGHQWTETLCRTDSDGDGQSNGMELGDPDCIWTPGSTPARSVDITHPGFDDSVPSETATTSSASLVDTLVEGSGSIYTATMAVLACGLLCAIIGCFWYITKSSCLQQQDNDDIEKACKPCKPTTQRILSLPKSVASVGGIEAWNAHNSDIVHLSKVLDTMCKATTVEEALAEVKAIMSLGHNLWAYAYMRRLYERNLNIYYKALATYPELLLPVVYTPTVGEACQKFGTMPMYRRGCYLSIANQGNLKEVLREYAEAELTKGIDGKYLCDCIVFSDGGRILGLGDLGAWGMGIPIGKLDLYTVCAGVNPYRTIPVIIDAGCHGPEGNTDKLEIRDHPLYTGLREARKTHKSSEGILVNSVYYGEHNLIGEFMQAATELFGQTCLLQFEDFNSNDAFPLLAEYRAKYLSYNDDIQGTAAVTVAALLGALKLRDPSCTDLRNSLRKQNFLFHGAGSANIGVLKLLRDEAGVPASSLHITNSSGRIWRSKDGNTGNFRNAEQKAVAHVGKLSSTTTDLVSVVKEVKPSCVVGAVGVAPNCFTKPMIEELVKLNTDRPIVFALSNPKTQAEITADNAYTWSNGRVIYGSGTWFPPVEHAGNLHAPGQVNNVYIFPGVSFGAICCQANSVPERFFMAAAEAVANSLDDEDLKLDRVVPRRDRIQEVALNVATAVVLEAQAMGIAGKPLGKEWEEVKAALAKMRWLPQQ